MRIVLSGVISVQRARVSKRAGLESGALTKYKGGGIALPPPKSGGVVLDFLSLHSQKQKRVLVLRVIKRFLGLVAERRLGKFLTEKSLLREVIRHGFSSGTASFFLFRSLSRYFGDKVGKRALVRVGEVRHQRRQQPGECPLSPVDLNRFCDSYALMKSESPGDSTSPYFVGGLWEGWESDHQSHLVRALRERDLAALGSIFSRIGADEASRGISLSGDQPAGFFGSIDMVNRLNTYLETYSNLYPNGSIARYPADWGLFPGALNSGGGC